MPGEVTIGMVKDLKEGRYVVIDGEPCKVIAIETSKPGKHGSAKARVDAISLFSGSKKTLLKPVDATVEVPMIEKKTAQVVAILDGGRLQLMDLQSYEMYELDCPDEFKEKAVAGAEVELQDVMGKKMITRVKSA
jgi:translation initiation factor 5A